MTPEVAVAVIGVVGITIGGWFELRKVRNSIGQPNGQGNLVEMCERLLAGQAGQDNRLAALERGQSRQSSRITNVERRITDLEDNVA